LNLKITLTLLSILAALSIGIAQDSLQFKEAIAVVGRPSPDSITLRWAPLAVKTWQLGNTAGYVIERYTIARDGALISPPEKIILTPSAVKPLPENAWEPLVKRDRYGAIAAQSLFGDRFEVDLGKSDVFTIVNKVRENEQRFSFALFCADMSPAVAKASGLWYTDRTVRKSEKYLYRINIIQPGTENLRGSIFIGPDDPYSLPQPTNLKAEFNDQQVAIQWDKNAVAPYTAYSLERSEDGKNFAPLSETSSVTLTPVGQEEIRYEYATDSIPDIAKTYYYRVRGITPFGEYSASSETVSGKSIPSAADVPYITNDENLQNTSILLRWEFPESGHSSIKGFTIERSTKAQGEYKTLTPALLSTSTRTYTDLTPQQVNYYRVKAHGLKGEELFSPPYLAQLIDSIPPSIPTGLRASIDQQGTVVLSWLPNKESDVYGYRVYRSNFKDEESAQITSEPIAPNTINDKVNVNTLNEAVYYTVMAIDRNQNHSPLSEILRVPLPDKIKPQPPTLLPLESDDKGVTLQWWPSGSDDVVQYDVYRKGAGKDEWQRLKIVSAGKDSIYQYTDGTAEPGKQNVYTIIALDDAGLESDPAPPIKAGKSDTGLKSAITWKEPLVDKDGQQVTLRWGYNNTAVKSYQIFKSVNGDAIKLYRTIAGSNSQWTDKPLKTENTYNYRIIAVFENGAKSTLSKELKVEFN
jgi:uncharacterized protein